METAAKLNNSTYSPRKMRLMADLVRGMRADKALYILKVHDKKMYSKQIEKLLLSAISNWKNNNTDSGLDDSDLYIKSIQVNGGRALKRVQPAPQGRAHRVRKRSNHIILVLDNQGTSTK
ncbi:MAG: 50S ribosomal protein L22 [Flavobacterium sp.]|nr:MAG: 50S ribosomal protein L22 [Flavobacterium sp.]